MRHWKASVVAGSLVSLGLLAAGCGNASAQAVPAGTPAMRTAALNYPPTPSPTLGATAAAFYPSAYASGYNNSLATPNTPNGMTSLPRGGITSSSAPLGGTTAAPGAQPAPAREPKPAKRQSALARFFASRHNASNGEPKPHVKHSYVDPATGRTNLPLSKPWLKPVW